MSEIKDLVESYYNDVYIEEEQLDEMGQLRGGRVTGSNPNVYKPTSTTSGPAGGAMGGRRGGGSSPGGIATKPQIGSLPTSAKQVTQYPQGVSTGVGGGNAGASTGSNRPTPSPAPTARPLPSGAPKLGLRVTSPTPSSGGAKVAPSAATVAKPAGSAMDQWAKANPKLAAAKAERDRTRGTSATTNPLMKDMKSSLPAPAAK